MRESAKAGIVVARYGEIALKGRNRSVFINQLRQNMTECLTGAGISGRVSIVERRLYVRTDEPEMAAEALARVFGITSLSPAVKVQADIDIISHVALEELRRAGISSTGTFKVDARRAFKGFPLTSPEINREVGAFIKAETGASVDLSDGADLTAGIEIQQDHALVYARIVPGAGGLPVPLSGRLVALVSVGLDSPVAAWMMMKRGAAIIPLYFSKGGIADERFHRICERLQAWSHGWKIRPVIVSHDEILSEVVGRLAEHRAERWACLFCKRAMLAKAEQLALEHKAQGIVMGDSLGQVASQTLENMRVTSAGLSLPIYRPLIGMDKTEVMDLARRIGTYEISAQADAPCPYLPARPITQAPYEKFLRLQQSIEMAGETASQ